MEEHIVGGVTLQNFQGIRRKTFIPFAELTLLYGPNSSGKSAVADALTLITKIFDDKSSSAEIKDLLARWTNHKASSEAGEMFVKVTIPGDYWGGEWGGDFVMWWYSFADKYHGLPEYLATKVGRLEFELRFSADNKLRGYHFATDLGPLFNMTAGESSWTMAFNTLHPAYSTLDADWRNSVYSTANFRDALTRGCTDSTVTLESGWLQIDGLHSLSVPFSQFPLDFELFSYDDPSLRDELEQYCSCFVSGVGLAVRSFCSHKTIQPVRPIPTASTASFEISDRLHEIVSSRLPEWNDLAIDCCRVKTGKLATARPSSAADIPDPREKTPGHTPKEGLWEYLNRILDNPLFLNLGYKIDCDVTFHLDERSLEAITGTRQASAEALRDCAKTVSLYLRDRENNSIQLEDVGAGVSQVIPVVIGSYGDSFGPRLSFIQQPELHLHPKLQAQVADIFIERLNAGGHHAHSQRFLVETHSEHLILRVLRRIRETSSGNIKNRLFGLSPDSVCVLYVDKDEQEETTVRRLRISSDGEFIDRWPQGIFTEREAELFDQDE